MIYKEPTEDTWSQKCTAQCQFWGGKDIKGCIHPNARAKRARELNMDPADISLHVFLTSGNGNPEWWCPLWRKLKDGVPMGAEYEWDGKGRLRLKQKEEFGPMGAVHATVDRPDEPSVLSPMTPWNNCRTCVCLAERGACTHIVAVREWSNINIQPMAFRSFSPVANTFPGRPNTGSQWATIPDTPPEWCPRNRAEEYRRVTIDGVVYCLVPVQ